MFWCKCLRYFLRTLFALCSIPFVTYVLPTPVERFAFIIEALCQAAAARSARRWIAVAIANLIWLRLRRTGARFAKLAARVRAGELPAAARTSASGASAQSAESRAERQAKRRKSDDPADRLAKRLPRGFAWLLRLVPEAAVYGSQLNHLLSDPEMVALLQAAPQMGRLLRPLCQMLGIRLSEHPLLQHTPRLRAAASPLGAPADDGAPADVVAPARSSFAETMQSTRRSRRRRAARRVDQLPWVVRGPPGGLFEPG